MQATVLRWDPVSGATDVVLDDGIELSVPPEVFARSGLRLLRLGQRVRIATEGGSSADASAVRVTGMTLSTFPLPPG